LLSAEGGVIVSKPPPGPKLGQPLPLYYRAARFRSHEAAGAAYQRAQATLYAHLECDLSTYRFILDGVSHVAVIGDPPPRQLERQLKAILSAGQATTLPLDVLARLAQRRGQATQIGPWVEGHYDPGKHL
jgi:hypothetical protein